MKCAFVRRFIMFFTENRYNAVQVKVIVSSALMKKLHSESLRFTNALESYVIQWRLDFCEKTQHSMWGRRGSRAAHNQCPISKEREALTLRSSDAVLRDQCAGGAFEPTHLCLHKFALLTSTILNVIISSVNKEPVQRIQYFLCQHLAMLCVPSKPATANPPLTATSQETVDAVSLASLIRILTCPVFFCWFPVKMRPTAIFMNIFCKAKRFSV